MNALGKSISKSPARKPSISAVAGPSGGGIQAVEWAAAYPEMVDRVIAVTAPGLEGDGGHYDGFFQISQASAAIRDFLGR